MRRFVDVCGRGLKVNAGKSKLMVLNGEEGLEFEAYVDGMRLECASEFKYDLVVAECSREVANGRRLHVPLGT